MAAIVSVIITAYNHEPYIKDALEGALKQKTDFPVEIIVHDDASTDATASIICEYADKYPEIIKPVLEEKNVYSQGKSDMVSNMLRSKASGKYIALCEGDDYWIDDYKLQKQYDFMEAHPDYSMAMHNAWKIDMQSGTKVLLDTFPKSGTYSQKEQIEMGLGSKFPATASFFTRASLWKGYPNEFQKGIVGDYFIRQYFASKGKIYYSDEPMSVYRYMTNGSFTQKINDDSEYYSNRVKEIINKFLILDRYLNYQYHDLFQSAIASNLIGYIASEGHDKSILKEIDISSEFVEKCKNHLDENYIEPELKNLRQDTNDIWIYGTSRIGKIYMKKLHNYGIEVNGFSISDGYTKANSFMDKPVCYLSDIVAKNHQAIFVLAVQPINAYSIIKGLQETRVSNYIYPLKDLGD